MTSIDRTAEIVAADNATELVPVTMDWDLWGSDNMMDFTTNSPESVARAEIAAAEALVVDAAPKESVTAPASSLESPLLTTLSSLMVDTASRIQTKESNQESGEELAPAPSTQSPSLADDLE